MQKESTASTDDHRRRKVPAELWQLWCHVTISNNKKLIGTKKVAAKSELFNSSVCHSLKAAAAKEEKWRPLTDGVGYIEQRLSVAAAVRLTNSSATIR